MHLVYVLSKTGQPLMPTADYRKVRILLQNGVAKVVVRTPFTIQLCGTTHIYKQPISLGVDAGSKTVGVSATTKTQELYAAEVILRTDVVGLLSVRRENRKARRSRKTRYRKARFENRVRNKSKGWLAPSIRQKVNTHLQVVKRAYKILPITNVVIEVATFDIQKIKNPTVSGTGYQQGEQLGFWNVREYVLFRDGHKCQNCKGKSKDVILNVHHIETRKTGGDSPNNLITLCETCHNAHHSGEIILQVKRGQSFRDAAFMGVMRWALYDMVKQMCPLTSFTYGYLTKNARITNGLAKQHAVDARCISGNPTAIPTNSLFMQKAVRKHNRQIHKANVNKDGVRKRNQAPKYVYGYQLFDKVITPDGRVGFVFGRRATGSFDIRQLDGAKMFPAISYKKIFLLEKRKTILISQQ